MKRPVAVLRVWRAIVLSFCCICSAILSGNTMAAEPECPICLEVCKDPVAAPCWHPLCAACAIAWLSRSPDCPTCRCDMDFGDLVALSAVSGYAPPCDSVEVARVWGGEASP